jgi:hypothetical protein
MTVGGGLGGLGGGTDHVGAIFASLDRRPAKITSLNFAIGCFPLPLRRNYHAGAVPHFWKEYRQSPPTARVRQEIQSERQALLQQLDPTLYRQVYQEICEAQQMNSTSSSSDDHAEVGPTGAFAYVWRVDETDGVPCRSWQRYRREEGDGAARHCLLQLDAHSSLVAPPTLSVDESFLAYGWQEDTKDASGLSSHGNPTRSVRIQSTRIATEEESPQQTWTITMPHLVGVEFGGYCEKRGTHDLFLIEGEATTGRPCTIHRAHIPAAVRGGDETSKELPPLQFVWSVEKYDPRLYLHVRRTKGGHFTVLQAQSLDSNETRLLGPGVDSTVVSPTKAKSGQTHHVEVGAEGDVFVLVRDSQQGSTLIETTVDHLPSVGTAVPSNGRLAAAGHEILEVDLYRYWMALYEVSRLDGSQRIRVVDRRTAGEEWIVPLTRRETKEVASVQSLPGACYEATSLHFYVDTPIAPRAIYEYNFISRRLEKISGGQEEIEEDKYVSMRVAVSCADGTMVPLGLVHRRQDANTLDRIPVILMAYGAYGQNLDLSFQPAYQTLLNRGYVLAFAAVRGGGELGVTWHEQGRRHQKVCGIHDYLACAEALHQNLLAKPIRLIAKAFSAGGVVVASAVNLRPQLFDTVVLTNAFLDVYASMSNPDLALTQHEWDEYGNPLEDDQVQEEMLTMYCPVSSGSYTHKHPRTLLIGALQDQAVPYWNALVYAQALRMGSLSNNVSVLIEDGVGHDLGENLLHVAAVETAFILQNEPDI